MPATSADGRTGRRVRGLDAEQRRAQRQEDLLGAALTLFGEKGYAGVSIEEICQTAYVGTKSFYELFDSKEACYLALFTTLVSGLQARMREAAGAVSGTGPAVLDQLVGAFAHVVVADPRIPRVVFAQSTAVSPAVENQRRANRRWAAAFLQSAWEQHGTLAAGAAPELVRPLTIGVIGGMFELIADWLHDHDATDPGDIDALIADLVVFHRTAYAGLSATERTAT